MSIRRISPENQHPSHWLNPRRRDYAERLIRFLKWHGRKIYTDSRYPDIKAECDLDRYQADGAIDDLYALGLVDIVPAGVEGFSVRLLADHIDAAPVPAPRFVLAGRGGNGHR